MASRLRSDRRGAIALTFALLAPLLMLCMVGAIDISSILTNRNHLQDATDAAALAVSAATSETPTASEATLRTLATNMLAANFGAGTASLTDFHVCAPSQADCTSGSGQAMQANTLTLTTTTQAPCYIPLLLPGVCTSNGLSQVVTVTNTSNIGIPSNIQMNILLDVSGSMIVGATPNDVQAVVNWNNVAANWNSIRDTGDSAQNTPCAFACHDHHSSNSTTYGSANSDMQWGLTNAHKAVLPGTGVKNIPAQYATTRFDVMIAAAANLIGHVQTEVGGNSQLAKNSYYTNVYSSADAITSAYQATAANDWTDPVTAINKLYVGLDTHINQNLPTFATTIGKSGSGATASVPLKFVIIVTDGLQSDFYSDFSGCTGATYDTPWETPTFYGANSISPKWQGWYATGCYASPISTAACTTMKNNGVIVAILETSYVPLEGEDPGEYSLYETFVRHTIYPNGPSSSYPTSSNPPSTIDLTVGSTVSAALQACASPGYWFHASSTDASSIQNGFYTLTDKFLASTDFIRH